MRFQITRLLAVATLIICALPAMAKFPEYKRYNGTYVKEGNGYKIEAKIDFNGMPCEDAYIDDEDNSVPYNTYYGYVKLISGDHQEGYNIVDVVPASDGPIFMVASWQVPRVCQAYPDFGYGGTLEVDTGMNFENDPYMSETLKKVTTGSANRGSKSAVKKSTKPATKKTAAPARKPTPSKKR